MLNLKKWMIKYIILLQIATFITVVLRLCGYNKSILVVILPQFLVYYIHLSNGRNKLYGFIKTERREILRRFKFLGKRSSWGWNIIIAARKTQDPLLKEVRNRLFMLNVLALMFIPNFFLVGHLLIKLKI